jgi:hypothetical protein
MKLGKYINHMKLSQQHNHLRNNSVHKTPPLVCILSQISPVHTTPSVSAGSILVLSTQVHLGLPSGLSSSGFLTNILYEIFLPHSCYMSCPSHRLWIDQSYYTWRRVQVMKLIVMQISSPSGHFMPLHSKYSPQHSVLKHLQFFVPPLMLETKLQTYREPQEKL